MNKKTILHIPSWYPNPDDVQLGIFIQNQIELVSDEFNHVVLYIQGRPESTTIETTVNTQNGIQLIHVTYPSGKSIFSRLRNFLNSVTSGLSKLIELNVKIDLVHCHVAGKNLWIAQKYFDTIPCLLTEHWSGFLNGNFDKLPKWKQKLTLRRINKCQRILTVSEQLKDKLNQLNITVPIEVISNPLQNTTVKTEINTDKNIKLLYVGDLVDNIKNVSGIIHSLKLAKEQFPSLLLTIIGDGIDKDKLVNLVYSLNLEEYVDFKGRLNQKEVVKTYAQHDLLIVNSFIETYSMVTLEALSSGIPVVATKCGGPEQFITSKNGLLINIDDNKSLSESIINYCNTPSQYPPEVIKESVSKFSNSSLKSQLINSYTSLIKN